MDASLFSWISYRLKFHQLNRQYSRHVSLSLLFFATHSNLKCGFSRVGDVSLNCLKITRCTGNNACIISIDKNVNNKFSAVDPFLENLH
jgi:hypothetical protein